MERGSGSIIFRNIIPLYIKATLQKALKASASVCVGSVMGSLKLLEYLNLLLMRFLREKNKSTNKH